MESPERGSGGGISLKGRQMWPYLQKKRFKFVYIIQIVRFMLCYYVICKI